MSTELGQVILQNYPELNLLCWDTRSTTVTRQGAFDLYINRWGHVHEDQLTADERSLIHSLTEEFGRGFFFPIAHGRSKITDKFLEVTVSEHDIDQKILDEFVSQLENPSYPGRRNGIHYFWKDDYEAFLANIL